MTESKHLETPKQNEPTLGELSPFFAGISKFDDDTSSKKGKPKVDTSDEMIGKSSNRVLNEKWNIKLQFGADFINELFIFLKEMNYKTIFGLSKKGIKIYTKDADGTHMSYIIVDRTEMSEYINTNTNPSPTSTTQTPEDETKEEIICVDMEVLEELNINNKYPLDLYFDTIVKNTMYIINAKEVISRRLNSLDNNDPILSAYAPLFERLNTVWLKKENNFKVSVSYPAFKNILISLDKKKSKKDKELKQYVDIKYGKTEIDFIIKNEIKSSSVQLYGDDVPVKPPREVEMTFRVDNFTKFNKLKLTQNINLYVCENTPLIIETRSGAGKIIEYFIIAPRTESDT